ncbi:MAG: hypothetical protein WAU54_17320 [Chania sp.]
MAEALVIVFPIYQGVTLLDFAGPYQFLSRLPDTEVIVASLGGETVSADGLHFSALQPLEQIERCDVLCVPGGLENDKEEIISRLPNRVSGKLL